MQAIDKTIKGILIISSCIAIVFMVAGIYNRYIVRNISISEPLGYYLKIPVGKIEKGNRYMVCVEKKEYIEIMQSLGLPKTKNQCPYQSPYLIKQVAGVPGDMIVVNESGVFVNNIYQVNTKPILKHKQINLNPLSDYSHRLESGEYFMLGITRTSYDSRYFGVIKISQFQKRVILLMNNN